MLVEARVVGTTFVYPGVAASEKDKSAVTLRLRCFKLRVLSEMLRKYLDKSESKEQDRNRKISCVGDRIVMMQRLSVNLMLEMLILHKKADYMKSKDLPI